MSKKSTTNIPDDTPIRAKDIASGKLVMRKRRAGGAVLPAKQRVIFLKKMTPTSLS